MMRESSLAVTQKSVDTSVLTMKDPGSWQGFLPWRVSSQVAQRKENKSGALFPSFDSYF